MSTPPNEKQKTSKNRTDIECTSNMQILQIWCCHVRLIHIFNEITTSIRTEIRPTMTRNGQKQWANQFLVCTNPYWTKKKEIRSFMRGNVSHTWWNFHSSTVPSADQRMKSILVLWKMIQHFHRGRCVYDDGSCELPNTSCFMMFQIFQTKSVKWIVNQKTNKTRANYGGASIGIAPKLLWKCLLLRAICLRFNCHPKQSKKTKEEIRNEEKKKKERGERRKKNAQEFRHLANWNGWLWNA